MLGTLTIHWIDRLTSEDVESITLESARQAVQHIRVSQPTSWISAYWVDNTSNELVDFDPFWDADDFETWTDWADEEEPKDIDNVGHRISD